MLSGLLKNGLFKDSAILVAASIIASASNFLFNVAMARQLGPADYAVVAALLSLIFIINVPLQTIRTTLTAFVSEFKAGDAYGKIVNLFLKSLRKVLIYGFIVFVVFALLSRIIANFLRIDTATPLILVGLYLWLALFLTVIWGVLNGLQRFLALGLNMGIFAVLKLLFAVLLVALGLGVAGVISSLSVAVVVSFAAGIVPLIFLFRHKRVDIDKGVIYKYSVPVFVVSLCLMLLINIDVLLVKHFFDAAQAGHYAAASILAKIVYFLGFPLVNVMFPKVSERYSKGKNATDLFKSAFIGVVIVSAGVIAVYHIGASFITSLLFGGQYEVSHLVLPFSIALALFSLTCVASYYGLAVKKTRFIYVLASAVLVEAVLITLYHDTLLGVIKILITVMALLFAFTFFALLRK